MVSVLGIIVLINAILGQLSVLPKSLDPSLEAHYTASSGRSTRSPSVPPKAAWKRCVGFLTNQQSDSKGPRPAPQYRILQPYAHLLHVPRTLYTGLATPPDKRLHVVSTVQGPFNLTSKSVLVATASTHFRSISVTVVSQLCSSFSRRPLPNAKSVPEVVKKDSSSSRAVRGCMTVYGWDLEERGKWVIC